MCRVTSWFCVCSEIPIAAFRVSLFSRFIAAIDKSTVKDRCRNSRFPKRRKIPQRRMKERKKEGGRGCEIGIRGQTPILRAPLNEHIEIRPERACEKVLYW